MNIPVTLDVLQRFQGNLEVPEIRVWCHPHRIGGAGSDTCEIFGSFEDALKFIKEHPEAEEAPLIAFRGYEINIFAIEAPKKEVSDGDKGL